MSRKTVAVLFGGVSSEHKISKMSALTVISNLSNNKYQVIPVYISKKGQWKIYDGPIQNICSDNWEQYSTTAIISPDSSHKGLIRIVGDKINFIPIDIVFPILHGKFGEDGTIQGLLELSQLPYVGCSTISSAICMDKACTKIIIDSVGISQANYYVLRNNINDLDIKEIEDKIGYPCFIKPANAGSSIGISKANNKQQLIDGINEALKHDNKIIIEEFIEGKEVECAVLGNDSPKASLVGEIKPAAEFYDFDAKYNNAESKTIIPANLAQEIAESIREKAIKIFKALDCKGLARVDFFVEKRTNRVIFNEINTMPGFTSISMYPMLWEKMGISIPELLEELIELAFKGNEYKKDLRKSYGQ